MVSELLLAMLEIAFCIRAIRQVAALEMTKQKICDN